jgi:hypothetical protein
MPRFPLPLPKGFDAPLVTPGNEISGAGTPAKWKPREFYIECDVPHTTAHDTPSNAPASFNPWLDYRLDVEVVPPSGGANRYFARGFYMGAINKYSFQEELI